MSEKITTSVLDIEVPHRMVELQDLKTRGGDPVVVRCERPDAVEMFRISQSLPGAQAIMNGESTGPVRPDMVSAQERLDMIRGYAPPLVEAGTVLQGPDGDVRPAFVWPNSGGTRHPLSLPGSVLSARDLMLLADTVAELAGYVAAKQPEDISFRDGGGEGGSGGDGTGSPGVEIRVDPVGSAS